MPRQVVVNHLSLMVRTLFDIRHNEAVADKLVVLMLKQVLAQKGAKALLVLPYVALVQEKVRWVRNIVDGVPRQSHASPDAAAGRWRARADDNVIRVAGFYGGSKLRSTWADFDIAVCTIEKASLLASSMEPTEARDLIPSANVGKLPCKLGDSRRWDRSSKSCSPR